MGYEELTKWENHIYDLLEDNIILGLNIEYYLCGIIACPSNNHYNSIFVNPKGIIMDSFFLFNLIYYHDSILNDGRIVPINNKNDWKKIGIPYIAIYKRNEIKKY